MKKIALITAVLAFAALVACIVVAIARQESRENYKALCECALQTNRKADGGAYPELGRYARDVFGQIADRLPNDALVAAIQRPQNSAIDLNELRASLKSAQVRWGEELDGSINLAIEVSARSQQIALAAANEYAEALKSFWDGENKRRIDRAVAQIHENIEKRKHRLYDLKQTLETTRMKAPQLESDIKREISTLQAEIKELAKSEDAIRQEITSRNMVFTVKKCVAKETAYQ